MVKRKEIKYSVKTTTLAGEGGGSNREANRRDG
jgi:hypothetical protein